MDQHELTQLHDLSRSEALFATLSNARFDFKPHLMVAAYVGSKAHNTYVPKDNPDSIDDIDIMGIIIPPIERVCGLSEWTHWTHSPTDDNEMDLCFYSVRKYVGLLLKSNPNVLGLLYMKPEMYLYRTDSFDYLLENRDIFASQQAYNSFIGYAHGQLHKMENQAYKGYMGQKRKELVDKFGYDCKNAAHAIRLLKMGNEFLETGGMNVWRTHDANQIRDIKSGKWKLDEVKLYAKHLMEVANKALATSPLPEHPEYKKAEEILVDLQRDEWNWTMLKRYSAPSAW